MLHVLEKPCVAQIYSIKCIKRMIPTAPQNLAQDKEMTFNLPIYAEWNFPFLLIGPVHFRFKVVWWYF